MLIKIDGSDPVAAGAAALALVTAMMEKLDPAQRSGLIKLAETFIGQAPTPPQPTNGHLRAQIINLIQSTG
jgi:hypothetical protein